MAEPLHIVIPTKGRASWDQQTTLRQVLSSGLRATLVVSGPEAPSYRDLLVDRGRGSPGGLVRIAKCPVEGSGSVRRWITRNLFRTERVLMLDDDLRFWRRVPNLEKVEVSFAKAMDMRRMLFEINEALDFVPMVGVATKANANLAIATRYNTRVGNAYALDLAKLREAQIKFSHTPALEDIDLCLKILQTGLSNAVINSFCWSEAKRPKRIRVKQQAMRWLQELYPDLVTITNGVLRIAWGKASGITVPT